jgi:2'-5' RNA ligase
VALLAVVAYPIIEETARQWIESIRRDHDPQAFRIYLHFTLVFPVEESLADVAKHVSAVAASARSIRFVIRHVSAVRDVDGAGGHVFLLPDEGRHDIAGLHDRLYEGALRAHLRRDIPFVPHITVGAASSMASATRVVQRLSVNFPAMHGSLESIELVDVGAQYVRSLQAFALGRSGEALA